MQRLVVRSFPKKLLFSNYVSSHNHEFYRHVLARQTSTTTAESGAYVNDMWRLWAENPSSVHESWDQFFRTQSMSPVAGGSAKSSALITSGSGLSASDEAVIDDHLFVSKIIRGYQHWGHLVANLDPLNLKMSVPDRGDRKSKDTWRLPGKNILNDRRMKDFVTANLDTPFRLSQSTFIGGNEKSLPLREILKRLDNVYCSSIGIETSHVNNSEQKQWLKNKFEPPGAWTIDGSVRKRTLARLSRATLLETFLSKKWSSEKRFGLEGCEVLIPAMKQIIDQSTLYGVDTFVMGMSHRGRLNVLVNVCRKPLVHLFTQFAGLEAEDEGSGDVKYHLGTYIERLNVTTNKNVRLSLVANSSHLEAQDPVVQGKTRAEQFYSGDTNGEKNMSIILHGDAAFAGQGVVFETFCMSDLPAYTTHGTIHIVINNQIGFTTDPRYSRSSPYCTDAGRVVLAPIFHVNADDPDAVIHVCNVAAEWRAKFHRDVVVDLVCYRRNGHNEIDEPRFTQPRMYKIVSKTKPVLSQYSEKLIQDGTVTADEIHASQTEYNQILEQSFQEAQSVTQIKYTDWLDSPWKGFFKNKDPLKMTPTAVDENTLSHIGTKFASPPSNFEIHKGIDRILKARMEMVNNRTTDWALGEAFAYGSLLKDGVHVRLSGQDVERGTFSHRHHVLHHQSEEKTLYNMLSDLYPDQATYSVCNSSLSEFAVLGFELGYSMTNPNSLVMWEAQFGDFFNTAQCIVDQFISSGESKWVRQSALVMLLPHGMEGMGPEHSSARLERFLQQSDDDPDNIPELTDDISMKQLRNTNWIVANCSTPANYFHIIRRQICLPFRKSLILLTPKSLLRHPECRSSFDEFIGDSSFQPIIPESGEGSFKKLIFCSGRVYYDLKKVREERGLTKDVAIARMEQFTPFPYKEVKENAERHSGAEIIWAQEEHKNQGGWTYVQPRLNNLLKTNVRYAGRGAAPSAATGSKYNHYKEFNELMDSAFKQ